MTRATRDDAGAIGELLRAAFAPYEDQYTPAAFAATVPSAEALAARFDEGPVFVVRDRGRVVGTASVVPRPGSGLYLRSVAVHPIARGRGIGRALVDSALAYARSQRWHRVELCTTPFLDAARRLYERCGFIVQDRRPGDLHGTPLMTMSLESQTMSVGPSGDTAWPPGHEEGSPVRTQDSVPAVVPEELERLFVERVNAGDIEGLVALYEPDAVMAFPLGKVAAGGDAIRQVLNDFIASGAELTLGHQQPTLRIGDLALTSTRLASGDVTAEVARRQPDGTWRWVIDQWSVTRE